MQARGPKGGGVPTNPAAVHGNPLGEVERVVLPPTDLTDLYIMYVLVISYTCIYIYVYVQLESIERERHAVSPAYRARMCNTLKIIVFLF